MKETIKPILLLLTGVLLLCSNLPAQDIYELSGRILNGSGDPLPNVSIGVEGSMITPAVSSEDGSFTLSLDKPHVWLIISPLEGYKSRRLFISVNNFERKQIYLTDPGTKSGFDAILDIGGEQSRRDQISSVNTLDVSSLNRVPFVSLDQYFQGKIPGTFYSVHSGMPGSGGSLYLRGLNSLFTNSSPLFVVDGMPIEDGGIYSSLVEGNVYNPLSSIEQQDISNVTVFNGGTGATLFGAKGSNGVVLIETLKPTETTTSINFALKTGISFQPGQLPQLNSQQYRTLANEILGTSTVNNELFDEKYPGLFLTPKDKGFIRYSHDYNWQDEIFTNSYFQNAYLSVKGGDAIGRYGLSIGYLNHGGIYKNTGFNRFTARFVGTFNVFDWLRLYVSANLATADADVKESALTPQTNPILTSLFKTPLMSPYQYDDNDQQLNLIDHVDELGVSNPKAVMENFNATNSNNRFLTSLRIEGDISNNLMWNTLLGLNINSLRQKAFYPNQGMEYYTIGEVYNISNSITNNLFSIYNDNFLSFRKQITSQHQVSAVLGAKWYINTFEEDLAITRNLNENDQYTFLQAGTSYLREMGGGTVNWNWLSSYGRVNYAFRDRYLLDIGFSGDLSSNIGKQASEVMLIGGLPFGIFYSAGAGWRLSQESFLSGLHRIDELKLRFHYGLSGNDNIGQLSRHDYYYLKLYRETSGMVPGGYGNHQIGFEKNSQYTAGVDFAMLGNRIRLSADYYRMDITDLLVYQKLDSYLGYDNYASNNADMSKNGFEVELFANLIRSQDFTAYIGMNVITMNNEITNVINDKLVTEMPGFELVNQTGEQANSFYGYVFEGVFSTAAEAEAAALVNDRGIPFMAGDVRYDDISGPDGEPDGVINDFDKTALGSSSPEIAGGFNLNLSYRNWGIDMLWQYSLGNELYNYVRYQNEKMSDLSNQSITTMRRWSYDGQVTDIPRAAWDDPVGNSDFSSRWIEDGSYLRFKYLTLSYNIPQGFLFFKNLNVHATAANLLTFTSYLGYDPEFSHDYSPVFQGIDYGLMPNARSLMLGIRFGL